MKRLFSAIQPTGIIHLGNYLGAIKQWIELQKKPAHRGGYESFFCIVDLHAITLPQNPKELKKQILRMANIYLAAGINPNKTTLFVQSDVPAHSEGAWLLTTIAKMGELSRMIQFKDKTSKLGKESVPVGLFTYPTLMAADILLYDAAVVPVGEDQKQHVELARDLAQRFNKRFSRTFIVPQPLLPKFGARIMGLDNPKIKMSKSASSPMNYIALTDRPEVARNKIMKAVTDSGKEVKYDPKKKPAISNLLTIYSLLSEQSISALEKKYRGEGYAPFKKDLAKVVIKFLTPFQKRLAQLEKTPIQTKKILTAGAQKAQKISSKKIEEIKKRMGLGV